MRSTVMYLKSDSFKWMSLVLPCINLKEDITEVIENIIKQVSINVLRRIFHPPPPPPPNPMRTEIKIITYTAKFKTFPETDAKVLTLITVIFFLKVLFLQQK